MDAPHIVGVNCNHCGASLEVDENTRFVTCSYCHSRLEIQRTASAVYTSVLEKIEQQTGHIAENLKVIQLQNDLSQLDREWSETREGLMVSGKNGRSEPSNTSAIIGMLIGVPFLIFWIAMASKMGAPVFFPLFGVVALVLLIGTSMSSMSKAGRLSEKRSEHETRRQQLIAAIEAEKLKQ